MVRITVLAVGLALGWWWFHQDPSVSVVVSDGELRYPGYRLEVVEPIEMGGRVLSRKNYHSGREAQLSPVDFALGWGRMADPTIYQQLTIRQNNRWFTWHTDNMPIPRRELERSAANVHLIPGSEQVQRQLARVVAGDMVRLQGQLVDVFAEDGWRWKTSRTRNDTGKGACEVLLVQKVIFG